MAANPSSEVKAILKQTRDLTTALSNDSLGVAGVLLSEDLICREVYSKMLIDSYTSAKKAAILVEAVGNTVEIAPDKFQCFLEILSEQVCAKEVVENLRSTYQSESKSLVHDHSTLVVFILLVHKFVYHYCVWFWVSICKFNHKRSNYSAALML